MILRYRALENPDPHEWKNADESERLEAVVRHHAEEPDELPNERLHASIHVVVEDQFALGDDTPVAAAIQRLINEGLDRHDAIHAVGAVLSKYLWSVLGNSNEPPAANWSEEYFDEVRELTAAKWHEEFGTED